MSDTPPQIEQKQFEMMMNLSAAERIEMACEMFMSARQAAFKSLPDNISDAGRRTLYLKKMYGERLIDSILADTESLD
jgi:hypothetical protein